MRIALVLGSGSAKGYAHIGVIQELKARGHEIVAISGTSMGAVIGGLEAAGGLEDFAEWACSLSQFDVIRNLDFTFGRGGVVKANRIIDRIDALCGSARIEDLPIPFTAVATDITARREVWFQRGPLSAAMRASMSMPGFITPVMLGDHVLVDGAVLNPVPVEPTLAVPADMTIAVSLHGRSDMLGVQILADADDLESAPEDSPGEDGASEAWRTRVVARFASLFSRFGDDEEDDEGREAGSGESGEAKGSGKGSGFDPEHQSLLARLERLEAALALGGDVQGTAGAARADSGPARSGSEQDDAGSGDGEAGGPGISSAGVRRPSPGERLISAAHSVSMYDVMDLSLTTMEDTLERVRAAVAPAHLRVEIPEDACSSLDFHRASEVVEIGRAIAIETFDRAGI